MAIPSSGGTEVFCSGVIDGQADDPTSLKWDGTSPTKGTETDVVPAHTIIIVKNILLCNMDSGSETYTIVLSDGSNSAYIQRSQTLGNNEVFAWNDTLVLHPAGFIKVWMSASDANVDVVYSYIKQDWSQEKP